MFEQLREDIACIHERDPAARSRFEILTCYPGLHAIIIHRLAHRLWKGRWYWAGRFVSHLGRMFTGIEIHPGALIGRRVFIDHGFGVVIGETAEIGDDCTIYQGVTLGGTRLYKGEKRHPTLESGVVVGAGAQILGGFTVGENARVGSNAVVVKPVPAGATAVGNPARIILPSQQSEDSTDSPAPTAGARMQDGAGQHRADTGPAAGQAETPAMPRFAQAGDGSLCDPDHPDARELDTGPLQDLLKQSRGTGSAQVPHDTDGDGFAPYGLSRADDDPLVKVLHELINHTARQDERIHRMCKALQAIGQPVENGTSPLDAERLNRMVE